MATPATPSPAASAPPEQRWKLPVLVGLFAVVSLAVGWFAGHGALHGSSKNAASDTSAENEAAENSEALPVPAPDVSNIEVVDLNNQHWLVPMQGPLGPSPILTPSPTGASSAQLQQNKIDLDAALPAPVHVQPRAARREDKTSLPVLAQPSGGSGGALPASGAAAARPAISIPSPVSNSANEQPKDLQPGKLLRRVEPAYPQGALDRRIEGTVTLYAVIDADGTVKSLKPLDGPSALVPAAVAAVRQWQYSPSLLNGRPIQTERRITIVFQLSQSQ
jgi:protein TonB